ncbi:response regulator [Flavobacterium sp. TAB 87]|uniref:response regulator n=1 Tax=Flavobacterium sp. TAB 87 TaxID=1729581 RepID=UPI00076BD2EE|nr:response regulator [Flavobacterium sp. TAB 87]KVV14364.1 transcriptional regulator RcsB [Flavobacterium sp. TAB 87]
MFKKVIVAEDFDSINLGIEQALRDLDITNYQHTKYCDDAYLKIRKAIIDNEPYDLLISDLSFKADYREVKIENGDKLIEKVRAEQPDLKIIAYSVEDKSHRIRSLFTNSDINGFVMKGRNSIDELKKAIRLLSTSELKYISPEISSVLQENNNYEIDDFDVLIMKHLSLGTAQDDIRDTFISLNIKPNSKSAIEKRISKLKDFFKANNTVHLVSIAKDMGII